MTHVVLDSCIRCKYTDCVEVCPVDCFHEGPNMLVIDPEACIDCRLCIPKCPVNAIVEAEDVPAEQEIMLELNRNYSQRWPVIAGCKSSLPEAGTWANVNDKLKYFVSE